MPWDKGADRKAALPKDWEQRRKRVLKRDGYRCTAMLANGTRCTETANQCDHIGDPDDHSMGNLHALCRWHHARKTSAQGNAARGRVTQQRPKEKHPGLRD